MREVIYTKYNSVRRPEYQISTSIFLEDETKYVEKKAITKAAIEHIETILQNAEKMNDVYADIKILSGDYEEGKIVFPFIKGKNLLQGIDLKNEDLDVIVEKITLVLQKIHNYRPEYVDTFHMTDAFKDFFAECTPKEEPAVALANIDGIFGNFIEAEDGSIWCIDCEWVLDFFVPIRFIVYRSLLYFYVDNYTYLGSRISETDFIRMFDFSEEDMELFQTMEDIFQQYVHGENRKYIYVEQYKKSSRTFNSLMDAYELNLKQLEEATQKVESMALMIHEQHEYIQETKRVMKNPFYALTLIWKKIKSKIIK